MKRRGSSWIWLSLAMLLAGTSRVGAQEVKFAAEVALLDCDGTPCIEATIGEGKTVRLGIDTGNVNSVVDTKAAKEVGLQQVGKMPPGAPEGMFATEIPAVRIGNVTLKNLPALAMELGEMIQQKQMPHVDGTLAYTAFKDRVVQLDFAERKFRVSEVLTSTTVCRESCDKISLLKFGKDGPPIVVAEGFAINGKKVAAQVDTMYTGSLLIYRDAIGNLGLDDAATTTKVRDFPFTDGGVQMKEAPAGKVSFHGTALGGAAPLVYFPTGTEVHEPDGMFDGTVGLELFAGAKLTLDFKGMSIAISK